jgi:hypothetical protein
MQKLAKSYAVQDKQPNAERLFFALHTYYATFIKLLAVQIATYYLMPRIGGGLAAVANQDTEGLRQYLAKMERGGVFADFGIRNFLEGGLLRLVSGHLGRRDGRSLAPTDRRPG